ncbi:MAG: hypothetical protein KDC38_06850 [Planctomycetes bacterium]|nr:hypothetical protein [Planctomycetota bacterium]
MLEARSPTPTVAAPARAARRLNLVSITGMVMAVVGAALCVAHFAVGPATGHLTLKLETKPTVMTVAYKAYGNAEASDGKYWLGKLVLGNDGKGPLRDLHVSYRVPGSIEWTTPDSAAEILPKQTAVLPIYPRFPSSVTKIRTRTPAVLEVKVEYTSGGETESRIEKRPFELRGVTEIEYTSIGSDEIISWYDMWDNSEVLAAFMTDEDEVVKTYFGKISETMGGTPYVNSTEAMIKLLRAIYEFEVGTGMVYMGAKGVPEKLGDATTLVQSVKLPREVIRGNSGTCIELTILMSSLLRQCGVKSTMVLIPGHAFPVIETSGGLVAFETTGIMGPNLGGVSTFEKALEDGNATWEKCTKGEIPFVIVDYLDHQDRGLRPPELDPVDVTALTQMLAERIRNRTRPPTPNPLDGDPRVPPPDPTTVTHPQTYRDPTGRLTVGYPTQWMTDYTSLQMIQQSAPWYLMSASDPQSGWGVDVYGFGSGNQRECLQALGQLGSSLGFSVSFGSSQPVQINGVAWSATPFSYDALGQPITGRVYLSSAPQGTYGVSVGGPTATAQLAQPTVDRIVNSIQLGR